MRQRGPFSPTLVTARQSGLQLEGEHFREQTGEQSSSPKTFGAAPRRWPRRPPGNLIPMSNTELAATAHRMDPRYFSSPVRASVLGKGRERPRIPSMGSGTFTLWGCGIVNSDRSPLPVRSHRSVLKTWSYNLSPVKAGTQR